MLSAIINAIFEAVVGAAGWIMRIARGALVDVAAEAVTAEADRLSFESKDRRRARRQLKRMAAAGDIDGLIRVYHRCGRGDHHRDLRIDTLRELARADRVAAEPLLREVIEGAEDAWMVTMAMEWVSDYKIIGLADAVAAARNDPRPVISAHATTVLKRLDKAAARTGRPPGSPDSAGSRLRRSGRRNAGSDRPSGESRPPVAR